MSEPLTVSPKGQITIPAVMRGKYDIKAANKLLWKDLDNRLVLKNPQNFFLLEGCLALGHIPDDEEELITPVVARHIMEKK